MKQPAVYMLASGMRGTLYIGITGWLGHRVWEHREGLIEGFTKAHGIKRLVWFELHSSFPCAIAGRLNWLSGLIRTGVTFGVS